MLKLEKTLLTPKPNPWSYSISGLVILASLFMSLWYWQSGGDDSLMTAGRDQVFQHHEYGRLFTSTMVHADLKHFMSNAIFFWIFGYLLNGYFGFWVFPVVSLVMGGLINYLTLSLYPEHAVLIGASGVVYFMAALWATLFYQIERGDKHIKRMMSVLGVSLILFFPTSFEPQVSYLAHAVGFAAGILSGLIYFQWNREKIRAHEQWRETEPKTNELENDWASSSLDDSKLVQWIMAPAQDEVMKKYEDECAETTFEPCSQKKA